MHHFALFFMFVYLFIKIFFGCFILIIQFYYVLNDIHSPVWLLFIFYAKSYPNIQTYQILNISSTKSPTCSELQEKRHYSLKGSVFIISMDIYCTSLTDVCHCWDSLKVTFQSWNKKLKIWPQFSSVHQNFFFSVERLLENQCF